MQVTKSINEMLMEEKKFLFLRNFGFQNWDISGEMAHLKFPYYQGSGARNKIKKVSPENPFIFSRLLIQILIESCKSVVTEKKEFEKPDVSFF